jgi:hypothetical protein
VIALLTMFNVSLEKPPRNAISPYPAYLLPWENHRLRAIALLTTFNVSLEKMGEELPSMVLKLILL